MRFKISCSTGIKYWRYYRQCEIKIDPEDSLVINITFQFQCFKKTLRLFLKILTSFPAYSLLDFTISFQWRLPAKLSIISQFSFKFDEQTGLCRKLPSAYISFFFPFLLKFRLDKWLHYCCGQILCVSFVLNHGVMPKALKKL